MELIVLIIFIVCLVLFPRFRCVVCHPVAMIYYAAIDVYKYFRYKKWRICNYYGFIDIYSGLFGKGKTLTGVHDVIRIFNKYNEKEVYDFDLKKWVVQHIHIISNVELKGIPFIKLRDTEQIVNCHKGLPAQDVVIVFIDEASTQFNSRNFKDNISATLLNAMLTCRHHKFCMILTAQRFNQVDALIRQVSRYVYECDKLWRLQLLRRADAWDMENCTNLKLVKSVASCWFVTNKDYDAYDTSAIVDDIKRKQKNGQLLSDAEVLELQQGEAGSIYNVAHGTRRYKKAVYRR